MASCSSSVCSTRASGAFVRYHHHALNDRPPRVPYQPFAGLCSRLRFRADRSWRCAQAGLGAVDFGATGPRRSDPLQAPGHGHGRVSRTDLMNANAAQKREYGTSFDVFVKCSRPLRMRAEMTLPQQQSKRPGAQPANTWMNWSWLWSEARPALAPRALCRTGVSWLQPSHLVTPSSRATVRLAGTALGIWRSAGRLTLAPRAPCRRDASLGEA